MSGEYILRHPAKAEAGCAAPAARPPRRGDVGLSTSHIGPQSKADLWQVNVYAGGSLIQVCAPSFPGNDKASAKRGIITRFSEASRRRLLRALAKIKRDLLPVFVTLTYPDDFPGDPNVWKGHLKAWFKRLKREHPGAAGFWKLELKPRQSGESEGKVAPHFHLLLWGLPMEWEGADGYRLNWEYQFQRLEMATPSLLGWKKEVWKDGERTYYMEHMRTPSELALPVVVYTSERQDKQGRTVRVVESWLKDDGAEFRDLMARTCRHQCQPIPIQLKTWVSLTWAEVVGSNDPRHVRAGTNVEEIRSRDGVMYYASKYVCKLDTESAEGAGRFWGIHNRTEIPWAEVVRVPVDEQQAVRLKRVAQRYIWAQQRQRERPKKHRWRGGCGMSFFCDASAWLKQLPALAGG